MSWGSPSTSAGSSSDLSKVTINTVKYDIKTKSWTLSASNINVTDGDTVQGFLDKLKLADTNINQSISNINESIITINESLESGVKPTDLKEVNDRITAVSEAVILAKEGVDKNRIDIDKLSMPADVSYQILNGGTLTTGYIQRYHGQIFAQLRLTDFTTKNKSSVSVCKILSDGPKQQIHAGAISVQIRYLVAGAYQSRASTTGTISISPDGYISIGYGDLSQQAINDGADESTISLQIATISINYFVG